MMVCACLAHLGVGTNRPVGPEQQGEDQHDERDDDRLRRADPDRGVGFQQADEDRRRDRAAEIAHAADHDDDEGLQHPVEAHGVVDADQRPEQHAARRRHRRRRSRTPRCSTHGTGMPIACAITRSCVVARIQMPYLPYFRNSQKPPMMAADSAGDHQPVPGIFEIEEVEVAGERLVDLARHRAELPERVVLQDQRHAEGGEDRGQRIAADQRAQASRSASPRRTARPAAWRAISASQKLPVVASTMTPT